MPSHLNPSPVGVGEVSQTHRLLRGPGYVIHVLGTAHISRSSCDEVQRVVRKQNPRAVLVEVCTQRWMLLFQQAVHVPTVSEACSRILKGESAFQVIHGYVSSILADKLGVAPGAEFYTARVEAEKCGAEIYPIDRPVNVTLARAWDSISFWKKCKFAWQAMSEGLVDIDSGELKTLIDDIKQTSKSDIFTDMIKQATADFPELFHAILTERDMYLGIYMRSYAEQIVETMMIDSMGVDAALKMLESKDFSGFGEVPFVAVVGAGHLDGIVENWKGINEMTEEELKSEVARLMYVPPMTWKKRILNFTLKWGIISTFLATTGTVAYGTFLGTRWMIRKGTSAASGYYRNHRMIN